MSALEIPLLADLVGDLAAREHLWRPHVHHDPAQRTFHELVGGPHVAVWLICWMPGHDTGFHDHGGSCGAVTVLEGKVREERLRPGHVPAAAEFGVGESFSFGGREIHRVVGAGDGPATTLHAYSPALGAMAAYATDANGRLRRAAVEAGAELRPDLVRA